MFQNFWRGRSNLERCSLFYSSLWRQQSVNIEELRKPVVGSFGRGCCPIPVLMQDANCSTILVLLLLFIFCFMVFQMFQIMWDLDCRKASPAPGFMLCWMSMRLRADLLINVRSSLKSLKIWMGANVLKPVYTVIVCSDWAFQNV